MPKKPTLPTVTETTVVLIRVALLTATSFIAGASSNMIVELSEGYNLTWNSTGFTIPLVVFRYLLVAAVTIPILLNPHLKTWQKFLLAAFGAQVALIVNNLPLIFEWIQRNELAALQKYFLYNPIYQSLIISAVWFWTRNLPPPSLVRVISRRRDTASSG